MAAMDSYLPLVSAEDLPPEWIEKGRIPYLDGLRAISIVLVLVAHSAHTNGFPLNRPLLTNHGAIGVDVFFAISGFLITLLLLRERDRTKTISLPGFYRRRVLRIVPAYVAFLLVLLCLYMSGAIALGKWDWLSVLTYTVNFRPHPPWVIGHIWSLSIEEQFYIAWPVLMMATSPAVARRIVGGYLAAAPILRLAIYLLVKTHHIFNRAHLDMVSSWSPTRSDSIAAGCLLALLAVDPAFRSWAQRFQRRAVAYALLALFVLCGSLALQDKLVPYAVVFAYSVNALCITTLIWLCINQEKNWFGRLLESRGFVVVGVLSYSLYLWQQIFLVPHSTAFACQWPQNICLAVLAGAASYLLVERPFLQFKNRSIETMTRQSPIVFMGPEDIKRQNAKDAA